MLALIPLSWPIYPENSGKRSSRVQMHNRVTVLEVIFLLWIISNIFIFPLHVNAHDSLRCEVAPCALVERMLMAPTLLSQVVSPRS